MTTHFAFQANIVNLFILDSWFSVRVVGAAALASASTHRDPLPPPSSRWGWATSDFTQGLQYGSTISILIVQQVFYRYEWQTESVLEVSKRNTASFPLLRQFTLHDNWTIQSMHYSAYFTDSDVHFFIFYPVTPPTQPQDTWTSPPVSVSLYSLAENAGHVFLERCSTSTLVVLIFIPA